MFESAVIVEFPILLYAFYMPLPGPLLNAFSPLLQIESIIKKQTNKHEAKKKLKWWMYELWGEEINAEQIFTVKYAN